MHPLRKMAAGQRIVQERKGDPRPRNPVCHVERSSIGTWVPIPSTQKFETSVDTIFRKRCTIMRFLNRRERIEVPLHHSSSIFPIIPHLPSLKLQCCKTLKNLLSERVAFSVFKCCLNYQVFQSVLPSKEVFSQENDPPKKSLIHLKWCVLRHCNDQAMLLRKRFLLMNPLM